MATDWEAVENAIFAWIRTGSGLVDASIIWGRQDTSRPTGQHIEIDLDGSIPLGSHAEVSHAFDAAAANGSQIVITAREMRELPVSVKVYGGSATSATAAKALAAKIQTSIGLPSTKDAFTAAGIACFDRGSVVDASTVLDSDFEARAVLDCRFYVSDSVSERTTFIEKVEVENTTDDIEFEIP